MSLPPFAFGRSLLAEDFHHLLSPRSLITAGPMTSQILSKYVLVAKLCQPNLEVSENAYQLGQGVRRSFFGRT